MLLKLSIQRLDYFEHMVDKIAPKELQLNKTNTADIERS